MGKGFDIKSAFKHSKSLTTQGANDDEKSAPKVSKREAFNAFFRTKAKKLPNSVKRPAKRKPQMIQIEPSSRPSGHYPGQRPYSMRPASQVVMPPMDTKEPAILAAWGPKSPSLRPASDHSQTMYDSFTGRHQLVRSPLSATSFPKPEPRPLSEDEVQRMFDGAPQLDVLDPISSPLPKVILQTKAAGTRADASDVDPFAHHTFTAASLLNVDTRTEGALRELPNMHSLAGCDPGTIGQAFFLQLPISDSNLTEQDHDTASKRADLFTAPEGLGLRPFDMASSIDRLSELGQAMQQTRVSQMPVPDEQKAAEMYTELFSKFLMTPKFATATQDNPTGLEVQMAALAVILDTPGLWHNFNYVEWRIRLGQLLWSEPEEAVCDDEQQAICERDVVLLQILLAAELLVRMDMSCKPLASRALSKKIQWDLILAQRFLKNVQVTRRPEDENGNRNSVFSAMTFVTANENLEDNYAEPIFYPRHEGQQLEGLLKFAEALSWPHIQDIKQRFQDRRQRHSLLTPGPAPSTPPAMRAYATTIAAPGVSTSCETGCFSRPTVSRMVTAQSVQLLPASAYGSESLDAGGWMSRSWLTGLVLPGETASHFLIATLLENSPKAIETLGDSANLYGGFIYCGRSYWSKSSVVGRVLAAQEGASDCMGWISSPSIPALPMNDWINIESKDLPLVAPRISIEGLVSRDSAFVHNDSKGPLNADDFAWPIDSPPVMGNEARYDGLTLQLTNNDSELTSQPVISTLHAYPDDGSAEGNLAPFSTSTAHLTFATKSSKHTKVTMALTYDVYFVSSHPCFPDPKSRPPSRRNSLHPPSPSAEKELPEPPCHPLHSSYAMEVVPAATLLTCADDSYQGGEQILILDCRGSNELELLSRAWCAKIGEHALVGKMGRTCLSCCVREARGLGMKIVIRI